MVEPPTLPRIHDYLTYWATRAPEREMAVLDGRRFSYAALADAVADQAATLWDAGLRPGDRAAVLSHPCPEFFVSFLSIVSIGAIYQGLSPKSALPELEYQISDARPKVLIAPGKDGEVDALAEKLGASLEVPRILGAFELGGSAARRRHGDAVAAAAAGVDATSPATIVYTSGTTGKPKGALLTHDGFTKCSIVQARRWLDVEGARMPCVEPINHVAAVGDASVAMLVGGGTVVYQDSFDAERLLHTIGEERIDLWYTDPAVLALCARASSWSSTDLSRLRRLCWSGGRAPMPLVRELRERCATLATSWGMTETTGSITYTDQDASDEVLSSTIGRPEQAYRARVITEDDRAARPGDTGELHVAGRFVLKSYWQNDSATQAAFDGEWFKTGDLVTVRDDGNLELVGRTSEMFKSGGENIYPREVEQELESFGGVASAIVVSTPDDLWGEVGHAFVVATAGSLDEAALKGHLRTRLARFKTPKRFTFLDSLPILPSGKVDRQMLKRTAREGSQ
jgi:acyl-CoA synthetase (AMP-forming)/AMP-acid ligase II